VTDGEMVLMDAGWFQYAFYENYSW
jgi:hypothetical protein